MFKYRYVEFPDGTFYVYRKDPNDLIHYYYNKVHKVWFYWHRHPAGNAYLNYQECVHKSLREVIQTVRLFDKKAEVLNHQQ